MCVPANFDIIIIGIGYQMHVIATISSSDGASLLRPTAPAVSYTPNCIITNFSHTTFLLTCKGHKETNHKPSTLGRVISAGDSSVPSLQSQDILSFSPTSTRVLSRS